jgi:hypothetical protein
MVENWNEHSGMKAVCPIVTEVHDLLTVFRLQDVGNTWKQGAVPRV